MKKFDLSVYLVTDRDLSLGRSTEYIIDQAIKGGATLVQLREKNISTREFYYIALNIKKLLKPLNIPLIINDRMDIALAIDADGLHIGQSDIPYEVARKILGPNKIIGLSVENIEQARKAEELDVDYIGISPVFDTKSKADISTPLGLDNMKKISNFTTHPMVGIGGINAENAAQVIKAGAQGIAVISAIVSQRDPLKATRNLRKIVDDAKANKK